MIRRMLIHTVAATMLVGAAALSWQAAVKGQGIAGTVAFLASNHGAFNHGASDYDDD